MASILFYAGTATLNTLSILFTDGLICLAWILAATMGGSVIVRAVVGTGHDDPRSRALRAVSSAALGLGAFSLAALLLGLAGLLNSFTANLLLIAAVVTWLVLLLRRHGNISIQPQIAAIERWLSAPAGPAWLWLIAMPFLGLSLTAATVPPGVLWKPHDPHPYDVLEYHLQVPREWYQLGQISPLHHNVFSFFPFNMEMQYLLAMHLKGGPWNAMYLAHLLTLAHMVLVVAAIHATVRILVDDPLAPTLAAVAAAGVPWVTMLGSVAYNEAALLLYGALATSWAILAVRACAKPVPPMLLSGAFAGLACGVKYTAVPLLLVALPLFLIVLMTIQRASSRASLAGVGAYLLTALLLFSPWTIRNLAWAKNPVFPEATSILGRAHFTPLQVERWNRAHAPRDDQKPLLARASAAVHEIIADWRYGCVLFPLGAIAACVRFRRDMLLPLALILALLLFWLFFTHLQSRFFVLAIPLSAIVLGLALTDRLARIVAALIIISSAMNLLMLTRAFNAIKEPMRETEGAWAALVGIRGKEITYLLPQKSADLVEQGAPLALIGDAHAFLYPLPIEQLKYRTVFDLHDAPLNSVLLAWLGADANTLRKTHFLAIEATELIRLSETYFQVPRMDADEDLRRLSARGIPETGTRIIVPPEP